MRKSKHFRKDVIIARIIAAIILILLIVVMHALISALFKPSNHTDRDGQKTESEYGENNTDTEKVSSESESDVTIIDTSDSENTRTYVIATANVKFRSGPGVSHEVIGVINEDEKAVLLEKLTGWYKVLYNGQEGYISADYSKIIE